MVTVTQVLHQNSIFALSTVTSTPTQVATAMQDFDANHINNELYLRSAAIDQHSLDKLF